MIFTIAPLVQEAKTTRRWLTTLGIFTGALLFVLGLFGAGMAWAGTALAARVTTPHTREVIASIALTAVGGLALAIALGELGLIRPLLPRATAVPGAADPARRPLVVAVVFGAIMAIFSPLAAYALGTGVAAAEPDGSPW